MDIEEFYDEDPRRRASEEFEFGRDWSDDAGNRYEVSWVQDTGEVYTMGAPVEPIVADGAGDEFVQRLPTEAVVVAILANIPERAVVERALAGWSKVMGRPGSIDWVRERLAHSLESPGSEGLSSPSGSDAPEEIRGARHEGLA